MRKFLYATLIILFVSSCFLPETASAYLVDWYFNPNGTGYPSANALKVHNWLDLFGTSFIEVYPAGGTFSEYGVLQANGYDGSYSFPGTANQITTVFSAGGVLSSASSFTFTSGTAKVYSDSPADYPTFNNSDGSMMQADDGTLIGTFNFAKGGGLLNPDYTPNGLISIVLEAQSLKSGYFFDSAGNDLSQWTLTSGNLPMLTLGFISTNATPNNNPPSELIAEYIENFGVPHNTPVYFLVGNNGQFRVDVVPEPTSMLLFGIGTLGLAVLRRRKVA